MSSSSGGSESTASMREGTAEAAPNMDPNASMAEEEQKESAAPQEVHEEPKEEEEATDSVPEVQAQIQQSPDNRMASVITINGVEAAQDVTFVEMNSGMSSGRSERSGFDNAGFVDDEAHGKGSGGGAKVVNGGGRLSPPSSPPPRPPSPAGPFLNSVVATTPPPSGANGRGPVMETPNSNVHNNSGLIMTPNDKEKSEIDGCTNVTEAVNLELVNMNPYGGAGLGVGDEVAGGKSGTNGGLNGIPVKRGAGDEETGDGGFGDPYDEYFVPVNEHRKYIRGEKLYVTKDRRRSQSWKRCICWGVGFTLLAIAILIAVLAGTGVILSQEEEGKAVESRGFSNHNIPLVAESRDPNAPAEKEPIPTEPPPEPSSSFTPPPSMSSVPVNPPTTEMSSLYVPRVLEGEMKIDSLNYTSDLENSSSSAYMKLSDSLKEELMRALFDDQMLMNGPADIFIQVVGFSPGSVVVKFHVGWRFKHSHPASHDPITMEALQDELKGYLHSHGKYLYTYRIEPETVKANHVMDMCQISNGGCSHECRYDYEEAKFMCNCPPGLFLDQTGKHCTTELIDDSTTTTSTKGPFYDENPWMPMQPKEPTFVTEDAKHEESVHGSTEGPMHNNEEVHREEDNDKMHEDHPSHFTPLEPEHETKDDIHKDHYGDYDSFVKENDKESEMHHIEMPVKEHHEEHHVEHHEEHQLIPSVGTGRSSSDHVAVVEHPSEESNEAHDTTNDADYDEASHVNDEEQKGEEKVEESKDEMGHLGHSVDSSENTSEEAHDSMDTPGSNEEMDHGIHTGNHDMSSEGEVTDGSNEYHPSHSLSNELHEPIPVTTTSENPNWNGLESHESEGHKSPEVEEHSHIISTSPPVVPETVNDTEHHGDDWPLKSEIISAVEHVIVKDENETTESTQEDHEEHMVHKSESDNDHINDTTHGMDELEAHVVMEGEEKDEDMAELEKEVMMEHHTDKMPMEDEDKVKETMEEHEKDEMSEENRDAEPRHKEDDMGSVMSVEDGKEEHKDGEMESEDERITGEEESKEDTSRDEMIPKSEDEEIHIPVVAEMHEENDVDHNEKDIKKMESHDEKQISSEGGGEVTDHVMHEEANKASEEVMSHSTETTFGTESHEMELTSMNHEKPMMETEENKENEHHMENSFIPEEHGESEKEMSTEIYVAATGENEADIANEKPSEKEEETVWAGIKETREHEVKTEEHENTETSITEGEVMTKNHEENTMVPEENMKEMEDKMVMTDHPEDHSMEKPSSDEESSTVAMENPEISSTHADNLANVLDDNEEEREKKVVQDEPKVDLDVSEDGIRKPDDYDNEKAPDAIPKEEILHEDDDPNIVPVEETAKEAAVEDIDSDKSISPGIGMRIVGLDEDKDIITGKENNTEMPSTNEAQEHPFDISTMSISEGIAAMENHDEVSKMPMNDKVDVSMSSSTLSPAENSIENLSEQYNSTSGVPPSAENDQLEHLGSPVTVVNESATVMTTPSPKENNIDDPPLHLQAGIPMSEEQTAQSSSTTETAIANDLHAEKEENIDEKIAELDRIEKVIDDMETSFKKAAAEDEENLKTISTEASMGEKSSEKEEKMMKEDIEDAAKVNLGEREEKVVNDEGKEKLEPENKEEVSSITTVNQDFTAEHANTVHAINPTSPSTTIEEYPKVEGISGPTVTKIHENIDLEKTATKDENHAPEPHLPFETDDNERSNNLATLDNEDALPLSEGGNEAIVKVGAVDLGLKSTTEHTNEILSAPIYGNNWPATALAVNNMNKTQQESEITSEEPMKEKEDVTKTTTFEIPIKKKGEFKKPIHHEDEISKPLFGKEGKETTNKVDKIGLVAISANKDSSKEEMNSEEMDDFTTTEMPTATPHNMDTASSSSTEAAMTASTSAIDKGGEKLNAISEDDSETKKDLGKALVKETVKDLSEAITVKPETTLKDESHEMEEKVTTVSVDEIESTTQEMRESEKDNFASEVSASKEEKETEDMMTTESSKADESAEITTTMPDLADSSDEKNGKGVEFKDTPETTSVKDRPMEEGKETTTTMNVVEEMVNPTSTEAAQGKAEELLKEMGGYGEGGHKVVPKSGVELMDHEKETLPEKSTTEVPDSVDSTSSSLMASSSTSSPFPSSSAVVEVETFSPTTAPPESETANPEVNNELEEKTLNKVKTNDETEASKNENATSEDPIPTMMIHEIVPSISHSSTSLPLEPTSSTSSPEVSFSKESEESTTVGESPEITTLNSIPDNTMMTSSPDTAGVTTMTHILEILDKDETSSFLKKDSEKEVAPENVTETSTEAKIPDVITTEKITVAVSNITTSVLPEIDQQYFSKCPAGQFQCTNGTSLNPFSVSPISSYVPALSPGVACVPLSAKCDSINDCSDGSDELGCIEEGCPGNFQCSNGQCLKRHLVCNGIVDCNDGSDEANCEKWQCQFDEFQCPSGRCIPVLWQCDGKPDCDNHTDEYSCQDSCGNNEYLCPERWCIPMSWRCNGVPECANGEDEKLCDCSLEQVKCGTGGCVAKTEVCDGVDQCPDQSDEWGCVRLHNETMKLEVRTTENDWLSVCADRWETDWSNFVCQSFGYSQAVFTEYPSAGDLDGHTEVFVLKPGASVSSPPGNSMRLPGVLQKVAASECTSGSIVEISCQEFTCGNHGLADGVAARLVGGDEAANGQWPSVALLYHTRQRSTCTASIVSPRWLVASYNCLHIREKSLSPDGWVAFGGGSTFDKDKPETQIRSVRSIVPYPQVKYNRFLYNHDVALVELVQPLTFTRSVGAICLPEKPIEPRQLCVTAGWGYTSPGEINFSQYLHYLPVPTIDLNECNSTKHYSGFITEDKICAGFTDAMHSPCYNDEGAPLMCVSEGGIWELQGVLSYHSNCGRGYHPSIFSSMTAIKDWMKRVVGSRFERRSTFNVRRRRRTKRRREVNNEMINIIWT